MTRPVLYLEVGRGPPPPAFAQAPGLVSWDQDDFQPDQLAGLGGLILPMHVDQRLISTHAVRLWSWLEGGGRLYLGGNTNYPVLPGLKPFVRVARVSPPHLGITVERPHPVLDHAPPDLVQANQGVQGFYGRGHVPLLPGAVVLRSLDGGTAPIDWELAFAGRGRVLVHAGNDPWTTGDGAAGKRGFAAALVAWLGDDA